MATALERIHAADDYVVRSLATNRIAREDVLNDPAEAFGGLEGAIRETPGRAFQNHKTQVAADSDTVLYFIRLADHVPKPVASDHGMALRSSLAS